MKSAPLSKRVTVESMVLPKYVHAKTKKNRATSMTISVWLWWCTRISDSDPSICSSYYICPDPSLSSTVRVIRAGIAGEED